MSLKSSKKITTVSLKELKQNLSTIVKKVANGGIIEVLKYNKPTIRLVPPESSSVRIGNLVKYGQLTPALKSNISGKSLKFLLEDRDE